MNNFMKSEPLLRVSDLVLEFNRSGALPLRALDRVNLDIFSGETVGLVGESGSGKTVLSHAILGLLPGNGMVKSGQVFWEGQNLIGLKDAELRPIRGKQIAMIFQDPQASLNPVLTISSQLCHLLKLHHHLNHTEAIVEARRLLESVHLQDLDRVMHSYAHELSGGMCQRVMIAMAISCRPKLLIADEPTSALDVTIQAEIVRLLMELRERFKMAILFVTHDLNVASRICNRIVVMHSGTIVEEGGVRDIFSRPQHSYTKRLLESILTPFINQYISPKSAADLGGPEDLAQCAVPTC